MSDINFQSGALPDLRTEEEKSKDYKFEELVSSVNPVNWVEKTPDQFRKFPIFNQNGSGSCVAQTESKELGIMRLQKSPEDGYIHFSAAHIYQRRSNKPSGGMNAVDARNIAAAGVTLEIFAQSQGLTDAQMDAVSVKPYEVAVGEIFKVPNYIALPIKDIDTLASFIQTTGKGAMVWFYFQYDEWTDHPVVKNPNLDLGAAATCRHSVTAVDFCLVNGKKCIIIEDSWGASYGLNGQRVIDEDFFKARNWYAGYLQNFKFEDQTQPQPQPQPQPVDPKPHHTFSHVLTFGQTDMSDVVALQNILKYEGFFPTNVSSTGYYGSVTAKGVLAFQRKYQVASAAELTSLAGRRVGEKTLVKLNQLYS